MQREVESSNLLCLACGETFVARTNLSRKKEIMKRPVGNCTWHVFNCCRHTGIFLDLEKCKILLFHLKFKNKDEFESKGVYLSAPYLDDFGETDSDLK